MKSNFVAAVGAATAVLSSAVAENLLENASFEAPQITGTTPASKAPGFSSLKEKNSWTILLSDRTEKGGTIEVGLTDKFAHTGKQSIYVNFVKVTAKGKRGELSSDLLPVKPEQPYRFAIWGLIDRQRPLTMDERRPHLMIDAQYFAADQETQVGDADYRVQMIPGSFIEGLGVVRVFAIGKWSEFSARFRTPPEAAFMKVSVYWESHSGAVSKPQQKGAARVEDEELPLETDGVIYFDDVVLEGARGEFDVLEPEEGTSVARPEVKAAGDSATAQEPSGAAPLPVQPTR